MAKNPKAIYKILSPNNMVALYILQCYGNGGIDQWLGSETKMTAGARRRLRAHRARLLCRRHGRRGLPQRGGTQPQRIIVPRRGDSLGRF